MTRGDRPSAWQQWARHPQRVWLRRVLFQVHLWAGIGFGFYIFFISVTGSVLVYRNELYELATPDPIVSAGDDPRTGADVGGSPPLGIWMVSNLIALHDDLLAGPRGRKLNGAGAVALLLMALTGLVIWWPGVTRWRGSLTVHRGTGWKRFVWELHGTLGFWSLPFVVVSGFSALYLCLPDTVQALADWLEPPTDENLGYRAVDSAISWLAYLHFGRINGIGIPCDGPGLCDQVTKAVWAALGLAPALMSVTGATLWWNRVLRPRWPGDRRSPASSAALP